MTTKAPGANDTELRSDHPWFDFAWHAYYATWQRRAVVLIGVMTAIRLAVAGATTLSDTEAYYIGWARVPSLSYYDHPPIVAWMTWLSHHVSHSAFAVRFWAVACSAIFATLLFRLTTRLFSERAGFFAVAIVMALPAFEMTSFLVNPEAALAPLWMLFLVLLYDLGERDDSWRPLMLGVVIGVAFLAKYTALLAVPIAIAYLASSPRTRRWFGRPVFYLAGVIALAIASPVIVWNATRHWPSVTLHLVERAAPMTLATYTQNAMRTAVSQWTLFHPLVFPGLLAAAWFMVRRARRDDRFRFLAWTSIVPLVFFFIMMVRVRDAEPHWTMVGYVPVIIAAGAWLDQHFDRGGRLLHTYVYASALFSAALLGLYFVHMRTPVLLRAIPTSVYDANADPINETLGWDEVRSAIVEQSARLGEGTVVASSHNVLCGHIQEVLDDTPPVYCASPRRTQFDFVGRGHPPATAPVVYVDTARYPLAPSLVLPAHRCELSRTVDVKRAERTVSEVRVYACQPSSGS